MRIEVHIRDRNAQGKFVGKANAYVESCRVYKEAGDGVRLDNLAGAAQSAFKATADDLVRAFKTGIQS